MGKTWLSTTPGQTKMARSIKAAPVSRARGRGLGRPGQAPPLGWGQGPSARRGGGALRLGSSTLVKSAATSAAPARLSKTRWGLASCSKPSCRAFYDCRQVSVQSPGWGKDASFPHFQLPSQFGAGDGGRVVVSLWCFLGNNPFFYLDVSSPIGRDTAPSAAPHQPLPCSVSLGVKMGGGGRCDLRGWCGVLSRLHQLGAKGLSWQVSQWELGGLRPHFPSRRVREALGPAPLFWAQEALRSSRFPVVLILPVFFISPVLNIASSPFLELPVSGCARDAPISAVPRRWGGWSDQSEVW